MADIEQDASLVFIYLFFIYLFVYFTGLTTSKVVV